MPFRTATATPGRITRIERQYIDATLIGIIRKGFLALFHQANMQVISHLEFFLLSLSATQKSIFYTLTL